MQPQRGERVVDDSMIRMGLRACALVAAVLVMALLSCATATAALSEEDPWGGKRCLSGSGAGQCNIPRGIATDPHNGHIFVADQENQRVDEFNALGQFVKAWGWDVVVGGGTEFEICHAGETCKAGAAGSGAGQFSAPEGISLDSAGDIFVVDFSNRRVEKFAPDGSFLLSFGGSGTGPGQFGAWKVGSFIATDTKGTPATSDDRVYVGDVGRIQRFDTAGAFQDECTIAGETVTSLAVDSTGNLYATYKGKTRVRKLEYAGGGACKEVASFDLPVPSGTNPPTAVALDAEGDVFAFGLVSCCGGQSNVNPIFEFNSSGEVIAEFGKGEYDASTGLATNICPESEAPGNLYVTNASSTNAFIRAYGSAPIGCFKARTLPASQVEEHSATLNGTVNPNGEAVSECRFEYGTGTSYGTTTACIPGPVGIGEGTKPVPVHFDIGGLEKGTVYHYRIVAKVGVELETGSDVEFKTKGPPTIAEPYVASVAQSEATLKALVNPEGLATECSFHYGTADPAEHSTPLQLIGSDREAHQVSAELSGLTPGAAYLWRIACSNFSGPEESEELGFFTYLPFSSESGCPNQALRTEASAFLPDCRAYEMVSPVDKGGGDIVRGSLSPRDPDGYTEATPDGVKITYTSLAPFGELESAVDYNQYLAARTERGLPGEGWSNRGIVPPVSGHNVTDHFFNSVRRYMAFTPDLCFGWLYDEQTPPLTSDAIDGYVNLFRRDNCGSAVEPLETLTDVAPFEAPLVGPPYVGKYSVQGVSTDGRHALFTAQAKLTNEAPSEGVAFSPYRLYDRFGGHIHLVSISPTGLPTEGNLGGGGGGNDWQRNLATSVSGNGSRVYWTGNQLLLRIHPEQGKVAAECSEPVTQTAVACTVKVSSTSADFWMASPDGSKALYTEGNIELGEGKLYEFDLGRYEAAPASASHLVAEGVVGVAGASKDLSRIYFVSRKALDGGQPGAPNLYLDDEGTIRLVATLSNKDVGEGEPGKDFSPYNDAAIGPTDRATRVSPDGAAIAFDSRAPLTEYDNTDTASGKGAIEVYLYDAESGELHCASCNPGGARPHAVELRWPYEFPWSHAKITGFPAAAWLPTWEEPTYASRPLSADGKRLFFNSYDALLPRDTNGQMDVYEWEAAGSGGCSAAPTDPSYFPQRGGCIYLISSGEGAGESEFWEASEDGSDVFFTTPSSLLPQDPGSVDLYDARVGGGFPRSETQAECEGEACQSPPPGPGRPTPASEAALGDGNVHEGAPGCGALSARAKRLNARARALRRRGATGAAGHLADRAKGLADRAHSCRRAARRAR